ncbi:TRAP transporter small permease subunit [Corynebacterium glyciniphilum]|uniref:TRAP transporter small permease subunit n=1 Tax=Corynebacterium glyciniphilum TaxID=1404244 RepID=UPI0011AB5488|nr:TRAP transporter small permease subunit [Corynebacterium glyciniphilum]
MSSTTSHTGGGISPANSAEEALEALPDTVNDTTDISARTWLPERLLEYLGAVVILVLAVFIAVTVVMRFTGHGVLGAVELSALAMVLITVLVIPAATAADDNFKVEILDMFNRPTLVVIGQLIGAVVQLIVALFLTFSALELLINDWTTKTTMAGELALHRYWLSLAVFVGFAVMLHATVFYLIRSIRTTRARVRKPTDQPAAPKREEG